LARPHRQILRTSSIIGGASIINVGMGMLRLKAAALLLGPVGVGLIGLLQNVMSTASMAAALGLGTAGTRQIAEANARGEGALSTARRALMLGTAFLALVGGALVWFMRYPLADLVLKDPRAADSIGWLALGVVLTIVAGSQTALLTGLRRIASVATMNILSAVLGSALALGALFLLGAGGVVWFVVAVPAAMATVGTILVVRLPRAAEPRPRLNQLTLEWGVLVRVGIASSIAGLAAVGGQLAVRLIIQRDLGVDALGVFQASWVISTTYLGFVLQALGTDYYPRLTERIGNHVAACRIVNDQSEIALFLSGPALLAMLGAASWVIQLLYSSAFVEAAPVLRWQVLADVLKVASWPLGYVLLASGRGRTYMLTELVCAAAFVGFTVLGLPVFGVEAAGIAYLAMYLIYLPVVFLLARRSIGIAWEQRVWGLFIALFGAASLTMIASYEHPFLGAAVGFALAGAFLLAGVVAMYDTLPPPLAGLLAKFRQRG
jgi:O-antigen/teichoic acid export membrane protein